MGNTKMVLKEAGRGMVCERCELADGPWSRLRGLMGRARLQPWEGLILKPASSIHTSFMRFPIDAVFLDDELRVLKVRESLRPWRVAAARGATTVLELAAGQSARHRIVPGCRLRLYSPEDGS